MKIGHKKLSDNLTHSDDKQEEKSILVQKKPMLSIAQQLFKNFIALALPLIIDVCVIVITLYRRASPGETLLICCNIHAFGIIREYYYKHWIKDKKFTSVIGWAVTLLYIGNMVAVYVLLYPGISIFGAISVAQLVILLVHFGILLFMMKKGPSTGEQGAFDTRALACMFILVLLIIFEFFAAQWLDRLIL